MSEELRTVLGRAVGAPGDRPDLDDVWSAGRARRTRARALGAAAAALVVLVLAAGAVALATGDEDQDVVAGPGGGSVGPPPAEPVDRLVTMEVAAGPVVDGLPTAEPGQHLRATYRGLSELFERGRLATWERWDGATWVEEQGLISGDTEPGGFVGGAVAPLDPPPTVPEDLRTGPGPDTFPVPDDLDPGWYRVCVPMTSSSTTTIGGTVPAGAGPEVTQPPTTELVAGEVIEPCAQLRVPEGGGPEAPAPPPTEPEGEVTLFAITPTITAGEDVAVSLAGELEGWAVGLTATWEAWDGTTWSLTHALPVRSGDEPDALVAPEPVTEAPALAIDGVADRSTRRFATPVVAPGWYRVCIAVGFQEQPASPPSRELAPCAQVEVTAAATPTAPQDRPDPGAPATWVVDPADPPAPEDTTVSVLVTRVGCNGGVTGPVLTPGVEPTGASDLIVLYTVADDRGLSDCPSNAPEPAVLDLGSPLGGRRLVDGTCALSEVSQLDVCADGGIRWPRAG